MPGLSEGMNVAIGVQILLAAVAGLVIGLVLGANSAHHCIVEDLKKAEKAGKSLKDAIAYLEGNEEETDE